jgi:hypothetical protein
MVGKNLNKKMEFGKKETHIKNMQILSKVFVCYDKKTEREKRKKQIKKEGNFTFEI